MVNLLLDISSLEAVTRQTVKDNWVKEVLTSQLSHGKSDYLRRIKSPRSRLRSAFTVKWDHTHCLPVYLFTHTHSLATCLAASPSLFLSFSLSQTHPLLLLLLLCIYIPKRKVTLLQYRYSATKKNKTSLSMYMYKAVVPSQWASGGVQLVTGLRLQWDPPSSFSINKPFFLDQDPDWFQMVSNGNCSPQCTMRQRELSLCVFDLQFPALKDWLLYYIL